MPVRLYVGNLPKEDVDRQELQAIFAEAGDFVSTKVIKDRKTGQCRGFAFVTVQTDEQADQVIEKFNGYTFKDTTLKIEKALPRSKGKGDDESPESASETGETTSTTANTPSNPTPSPVIKPITNAGGGGSSSSSRRGKKSRRGGSPATSTSSSSQSGDFQPDPRWADELAKLKEMLAAQASNP